MSQMPISSSPFDKVLRVVTTVRTKGALAGVNILLLAIVFSILMVFGASVTTNQMWLIVTFLVVWQGFVVFAMFNLPTQDIPLTRPTVAAPAVVPVQIKAVGKTTGSVSPKASLVSTKSKTATRTAKI